MFWSGVCRVLRSGRTLTFVLALVAFLTIGATAAQGQSYGGGPGVEMPAPVEQVGCTAPAPTSAEGYAALWSTLDEREWGGADVSISVPLEDGRVLWLYGDTFSSGRFAHSTAIVQDGGCLTVSHGGAQLLPNRSDDVAYWIESARAVEGGVLVTAEEMRIGDAGTWDFSYTGFTATALVEVDEAGDVSFVEWADRVRAPAADPGEMIIFGDGHFGYSVREHPWAVLASGEILTTVAQNFDDGVMRRPSAYAPLWFEGGEHVVRGELS